MNSHAHPTLSSAAASAHAPASPSLELLEARQLRDSLKLLLGREQSAMAEFLVALADFDRRRGWEALGHANLFSFVRVELGLSRSGAYWRVSAARLVQRFPEVIAPLRDGRLCMSTTAELAKVLTEENRSVVVPRFFGLSAREAQELVAELQPREVPSTKMVVTRVTNQSVTPPALITQPLLTFASSPPADEHPTEVPLSRVLTSDFANGGGGRGVAKRDEIVPLTADLRRVHFNVGKQVVKKLEAAREGLSHAIPGATMEQVLEAALDLLLEKQARARALVKKPRRVAPTTAPSATVATGPSASPTLTDPTTTEPVHRRDGPRETIPAAVRRAVWARDQGCCQWPLDSGGRCGSAHRLELDHIQPRARSGEPTEANLRLLCAAHDRLAARQAFGARCVERYRQARSG